MKVLYFILNFVMSECTWITINREISESQLICGAVDHNNENLYIGRAKFKNDLIPGKVLSDLKSIHISYGESEYSFVDFEVLVNDADYSWVKESNGNIPPNAVIGGQTELGELLYVARAKHLYLTIPGKVHPSHNCAYVPCDWKEHAKNDYEVLVKNERKSVALTEFKPQLSSERVKLISGFEWISYSKSSGSTAWPKNAVIGGNCTDCGELKDQYIARTKRDSNVIVGYAYKNGIFHGTYNGKEIRSECYEIMLESEQL